MSSTTPELLQADRRSRLPTSMPRSSVVDLELGDRMADEDYERCRFSVSCETEDLAVLHCLRALAQYAEGSNIPKNIPWGGTGEAEWQRNHNVVTFRFTSSEYRSTMVSEAARL